MHYFRSRHHQLLSGKDQNPDDSERFPSASEDSFKLYLAHFRVFSNIFEQNE